MNRKTEAEKVATQITKTFIAIAALSPRERYEAFEAAAHSLDRSGSDVGVEYVDTCGILANRHWLQTMKEKEQNG